VCGLSDRFAAAIAAIDAANAGDPQRVTVRGEDLPLALAHGRLAADWVPQLVDAPDEAMLLAARAHHLRRWELARSSYPEGRAGYLRWRRDQKQRHAADVVGLLGGVGYDEATINRVQVLLRRVRLDDDSGTQAMEDVACLAFLETQLGDLAGRLDDEHMVSVVQKVAAKMSPAALDLVGRIPLADEGVALLGRALS
jgi:Domain of unknown function (DUF4202)